MRSTVIGNFLRDRGGNFATLTALSVPVVLAAAAVTIDAASLYGQRRDTQGLADLAAIAAAANIGSAEQAAVAVLRDNGIEDVQVVPLNAIPEVDAGGGRPVLVTVVPGRYGADRSTAAAMRFQAGTAPFNAVKVSVRQRGTRFFDVALGEDPVIATTATASAPAEAVFSVGSRLLALEGGVVNALLSGLTGSQISLTAVDHQALLETDVELFGFMQALATELHLTAGTYDDVLQSEVRLAQIATALGKTTGVGVAAARVLDSLSRTVGGAGKPTLKLGRLVSLGTAGRLPIGSTPSGLAARIGVMQLLSGGAAIANGVHQVQIDLGVNVPAVLAATLDLAIGEPMQRSPSVAVGEAAATVRTAQIRLLLSVEVGGPTGLLGTRIQLPVYLEIARAEATLASVTCPTGRPDSIRVGVSARPGILDARIAAVNASRLADFSGNTTFAAARILQAPLVTINGAAHVTMGDTSSTTLSFDRRAIDRVEIKTVTTRNFTQSLTQSLLGNLALDVRVVGLGIGLPQNLTASVSAILGGLTPTVDRTLVSILATLGIRIGEADVAVHAASCGRSVLVQ